MAKDIADNAFGSSEPDGKRVCVVVGSRCHGQADDNSGPLVEFLWREHDERCEAARHLAISSTGPYGVSYEIFLEEKGRTTTMTFVHHLADRSMAADFGPGWEFYLDLLVDSREGRPLRKFAEYYPSQKQYFLELVAGQ
jgi:hypothetical protein